MTEQDTSTQKNSNASFHKGRLIPVLIILLLMVVSLRASINLPATVMANGQTSIDFFPVGLYSVQTGADLNKIETTEFNTVHKYDATQVLTDAVSYLEAAQNADLRVQQNMPEDFLYNGAEFWTEWVTTLSAFDSLAWWYLPEEPILHNYDRDTMAVLYQLVHQYDPQNRPVALFFGTTQNLEDWCDVTDIVMLGCYPEYHGLARACIKFYTDAAQNACPGKTIISVLAFFDSNDFGRLGGYPTPHDARFDAYTSIIEGARGLTWYSFRRGEHLADLWIGLQGIAYELDQLSPMLLSPNPPQTITATVIAGPQQSPVLWNNQVYDSIQFLQKGETGNYILASNLATDTVTVQFSELPSNTVFIRVKNEGRGIFVSNGAFQDSFIKNGVHIYELLDHVIEYNLVYLPLIIIE